MKRGVSSAIAMLFACSVFALLSAEGAEAQRLMRLSGEVRIDGSSTVFPIMEAVSEEYTNMQPAVKTPISISGTGGGFTRFVKGEVDLNLASRPIKEEEERNAKNNHLDYTAFRVAYDGISIIVHPANTWMKDVTVKHLQKMWSEDGTIKRWSDMNPKWPREIIRFYAPGLDSGTYDHFQRVILGERPITKHVTLSEDDNVLIRGVMHDKYAIAFLGYAYYSENKDKIKAVHVNGVLPTKAAIQSGRYAPLSRPLYVYANHASIQSKRCVYDYLQFTLQHAGPLAEEVGYIALPEYEYKKQRQQLEKIRKHQSIKSP
ncbi:MAG: PstS family phosphate ABC transporter substrate-binding protein [Ectobacillus sp.]